MKINESSVVSFFLTLLLAVTSSSNGEGEKEQGKLETTNNKGGIIFMKDDLKLGSVATKSVQSIAFQNEATSVLKNALKTHTHATGEESFRLAKNRKVVVDSQGRSHARFEQTYDGLDVVGAALVMHTESDGKVYAINGEFAAAGTIDPTIVYNCSEAFYDITSYPYYENVSGLADSTWLTECELVVVVDSSGVGHKAWLRLLGYQPVNGPYQKDKVHASVKTGKVVAVHPQVHGALSLETYNCHHLFFYDDDYYDDDYENNYTECTLVSKRSGDIDTGDIAIDDAHNFARLTYKFYFDQYGRDSLDDHGLTLKSFVHYGRSYNNAFWDGAEMAYGDGDGVVFSPLSKSPEVVGHELTHGVTQYSSNLIYLGQSGALNEAISDIFGATISRQVGQSPDNVFLIAEDVYTPSVPGDALRNMADPAQQGDTDLYVNQYRGTFDNGGVHYNSGLVNLAFKLLVTGGVHPRYPNTINVPAIDADFDTSLLAAARIFYMANTACLTPHSGFFAARDCTVMHAGAFASNVDAAWTAVGVTTVGTPLTLGVPLLNQALQEGLTAVYTLDVVPAFSNLECKTLGDSGDVDLFVDLHYTTGGYDSCISEGFSSNEDCIIGQLSNGGKAVITLLAYRSFTGVTIQCTAQIPSLTDGVIIPLESSSGPSKFVLNNVPPGSSVSCLIIGPYDFDINLVSASDSDSCGNSLSSFDFFYSACSVGPLSDPSIAHVTVSPNPDYDDFSDFYDRRLLCKINVPFVLSDNIPTTNQVAKIDSLTTYVIENVAAQDDVWCKIDGINIAVLMVYLPTSSDRGEECRTYTGYFDGACNVGPATFNTKAVAILYAFEPYTQTSLTCSAKCALEGMTCSTASDCCDSSLLCINQGSQSVCSALPPPTLSPTSACAKKGGSCGMPTDCCLAGSLCRGEGYCFSCKKKKKKCKRSTDCCSGQCNKVGKRKKCA